MKNGLDGYTGERIQNPVKAIRNFCIDICMCGSSKEVELCSETSRTDCPLYPFRFGKNPYRTKKELSEEQKTRLAEQLKNARK